MRRGSGKAKDRGSGSEGRPPRGPEPGSRREERGELSDQHWLPLARRGAWHSGALRSQAARAAAGFSASASGRPGSRPPSGRRAAPRRRGVGKRTHQLRPPTRGAPDAGSRLVLPEAAKLWARPRWLAASSRFSSGDWAGSGGVGRRERAAAALPLGRRRVGPGGGGDGSWAPPAPPPLPPLLGAVLRPPAPHCGLDPPAPLLRSPRAG